MKAISLWQPWASAIATGAKLIETRSWKTDYRGEIAIHAAKRFVRWEMDMYLSTWNWQGALGLRMGQIVDSKDVLPRGAVVAIAKLIDCRPTESFAVAELDVKRGTPTYQWTERELGNFEPGRFGWVFGEVLKLSTPVPCRGAQGLFDI